MSELELKAEADSEKEVGYREKYFCQHRGEAARLHVCKPCQGSRKGVVYDCDLHGECTILSVSAKSLEDGRRLPA